MEQKTQTPAGTVVTTGGLCEGGEGGIRTLGELAPTLVFETSTIGHSVTSPGERYFCLETGAPQQTVGAGMIVGSKAQWQAYFKCTRDSFQMCGQTNANVRVDHWKCAGKPLQLCG